MAHECPNCGQACYCHGDIDDIFMDTDEAYINCDHCEGEDDQEDDDRAELDKLSMHRLAIQGIFGEFEAYFSDDVTGTEEYKALKAKYLGGK